MANDPDRAWSAYVALTVAERGRAQALAVSMTRALDSDTEAFEPPIPLNLEQIQDIAVQQKAILVEYSDLSSGRILIWVIQPDGTIHSTEGAAAALDDSLGDTTGQFATLGHNSRGGELPAPPEYNHSRHPNISDSRRFIGLNFPTLSSTARHPASTTS